MSRLTNIGMIGDYLGHGRAWVSRRVENDGLPVVMVGRRMESETKWLDKWLKGMVVRDRGRHQTVIHLSVEHRDHFAGVIGSGSGIGVRSSEYFGRLLDRYVHDGFKGKGKRVRSGRFRSEVNVNYLVGELDWLDGICGGVNRSGCVRELLGAYREGGGNFENFAGDFVMRVPTCDIVHRGSICVGEDLYVWLGGFVGGRAACLRYFLWLGSRGLL